MNIVGVGGYVRSGKDTLAEMLIDQGYFGFSFGDYVRERARERHSDKPDPISVENMTETSNWLRETQGADVVLVAALKEFKSVNENNVYKGVVLFSVRAPVEVDFILSKGGELVWVEANTKVRYERGLAKLREGESKVSFEEFKRQEELQWTPQPGIPEEVQMNIAYVKERATIVIENNENNLHAFEREVSDKLHSYLS